MRVLLALGVGLAAFEATRLRYPARAGQVGMVAAALTFNPILAMIGAAGTVLAIRFRRLHRRRAATAAARDDLPLLAELVAMGLAAGLTLTGALESARNEVHPDLAAGVDAVLRRARRHGMAAALEEAGGTAAGLWRVAARAVVSGARLAGAVETFVEEAHAEERARRLAAARRLPVRLLVPLALLILPGFVVLTVGPTLLAALERFSFPGS